MLYYILRNKIHDMVVVGSISHSDYVQAALTYSYIANVPCQRCMGVVGKWLAAA